MLIGLLEGLVEGLLARDLGTRRRGFCMDGVV